MNVQFYIDRNHLFEEVERQNRSILRRLEIIYVKEKEWREKLIKCLLIYSPKLHSITEFPLANMVFKMRCKFRNF